ncbi:hypothetical protein ZHAS_00011929 [Anopheles sinensis]|uniref:Uncharacterized protein n=1 Tax=Anopheles sinensis TaxID=74873 RepID=A0A084W1K0_ANOSI|nr:hypothetical protein ZHAS_00011929 [Anopheles sinensis]
MQIDEAGWRAEVKRLSELGFLPTPEEQATNKHSPGKTEGGESASKSQLLTLQNLYFSCGSCKAPVFAANFSQQTFPLVPMVARKNFRHSELSL